MGLLPPIQSSFWDHHSSETALLSLLSQIYMAIDHSHLSLLVLFDISSAFDMVDHEILLQRFQLSCGMSNSPLLWFKSYLSGRSQMVILGDSRSKWARVRLGVPQGSVLGPILHILYMANIPLVIANHDPTGHLYVDDIQAFEHGSPINQLALVDMVWNKTTITET